MALPVAILAGGLARRMRPLTDTVPKSLIEISGRPFAAHQVVLLQKAGIDRVVFLLGHLGEMVQAALGGGDRWGIGIDYVHDGPRPLGTGGAVRAALSVLGDAFFVLYGDSYLDCDYAAIEATFLTSGKPGLMTVCRNDDRWDRSNVEFEADRIKRYDKHHRTPGMHHIDYGLGVFRSEAFAGRRPDEAFDLADVYQTLISEDRLAAVEVPGRFYEIGSPSGLSETAVYLAEKGVQSP